jgi:ubiquinone/menaquinone biosynthesis C-methylase UbiE/PAS domain-containing protein
MRGRVATLGEDDRDAAGTTGMATSSDALLFISHASEDRQVAMEIVADLERRGIDCWIAPRNIPAGRTFAGAIVTAIESCWATLLVFSERCNTKQEHIGREISVAIDSGKTIIPLRIQDARPQGELKYSLTNVHWIDGFASLADAIDEVDRTFHRLKGGEPGEQRLSPSEIEAARRKITALKENNFLGEETINRLTAYFGGDAVLRPRKNSLEGLFIEYSAKRISFEELWRTVNAPGPAPVTIEPKVLDPGTTKAKKSLAEEMRKEGRLPDQVQGAPEFNAITATALSADDLAIRPTGYIYTPMYLLDSAYRIIDWNDAFTLAFDKTMEGRKGRSVLEWTYFLDNYEQVLKHGVKAFADPNNLPPIDVEPIDYTSIRYGKLSATKRAYQIPNDDGACMAWLVTLGLKFADSEQALVFHRDLIDLLAMNLMWSEYAMSYDRVLNSTRVYPQLLDKLIGGQAGVRPIPDDARILDLGAGTGNLAYKLITGSPNRLIFAAEYNRTMLAFLRLKCRDFLRDDEEAGGIIARKQDITSLFGLKDNYFDFVILNNVLYAVQDALACLKEAYRVLKPGGELRLSGPRKDTKLPILFNQILKELKESNAFHELEPDYQRVLRINELKLGQRLHRWSTEEVKALLREAGFSRIVHSSEDVYAGQSMLVCAVK